MKKLAAGSKSTTTLAELLGPNSEWGRTLLAEFKPDVVFSAIVMAYTVYCLTDNDIYQIDCDVISGKFFKHLGIDNFPGELIDSNNSAELQKAFWIVLACLVQNQAAKFCELEPFGNLYKQLFITRVREQTGQFFTPEYLVEKVLNLINLDRKTICDPACGPGIFLISAIKRLMAANPQISLSEILERVHGIDLDPLLALAARANYLLQIKSFLPLSAAINLPIENVDTLCITNHCQYDIIIGNPPWIGWEKLPPDARQKYQKLWHWYNLIEHSNLPRIGKVRKEFSALFTLVVMDKLLKPGGELGFLITRTIIKNSANAGFRRLKLPNAEEFCIRYLEQLTDNHPFPEVISKFLILIAQKKSSAVFPITYQYGAEKLLVYPQSDKDWTKPWLILTSPQELEIIRSITSKSSDYRAHLGCNNGGLAGCYWIKVIEETDQLLKIKNLSRVGKIKVPEVVTWIERELVYTLVKSSTSSLKRSAAPIYIIIPHKPGRLQTPLAHEELRRDFPYAYQYFTKFEQLLRQRSGYKTILNHTNEFWAIYNLGEYSNSPWKVCWSVFGNKLNARVIPERYQPMHTVAYIALDNQQEAFYLMGILNSSLISFVMAASSFASTKSFGTPSVVENLGLPQYNPKLKLHRNIASLAFNYQEIVRYHQDNHNQQLLELSSQLDELVVKLYGLDSGVSKLCQAAYLKLQKL